MAISGNRNSSRLNIYIHDPAIRRQIKAMDAQNGSGKRGPPARSNESVPGVKPPLGGGHFNPL